MYRIDKKLYKKLQQIKLDEDLPTINAVIEKLVEKKKSSRK
jgi:predicted CopG family antitoxin